MYFLRDKKLASDLNGRSVTQKQEMLYLLATAMIYSTCFTSFLGHSIWSEMVSLTIYNYTSDIFLLVITLFSILVCYRINKQADDKEFVSRYICLGFPIMIQSMFLSIFCHFPIILYEGNSQLPETTLLYMLAYILVLFYVLWRYIICFKIASGQKEYGK